MVRVPIQYQSSGSNRGRATDDDEGEGAGLGDIGRHVGQGEAQGLKVADRVAELLTFLQVGLAILEGGPGEIRPSAPALDLAASDFGAAPVAPALSEGHMRACHTATSMPVTFAAGKRAHKFESLPSPHVDSSIEDEQTRV